MDKPIDVLKIIKSCVEDNKSFVVTGGAGSGKTELLKNTLNEIKKIYDDKKIVCITHTNVAVKEISERTYNIFEVSTIHSFCQNSISKYKINLKECLIDIFSLQNIEEYALEKGLEEINYDIYKKVYEKYWKKQFSINKVKTDKIVNKKEFDLNKEYYINNLNNEISLLNLSIKKLINESCDSKKIAYNETKYNSIKNFSYGHDGVLQLFSLFLEKYSLFRKILKDRYSIIFIDEYQDTNKGIVEALLKYFVDDNHMIGLFGDHMQSIYNDGIGNVSKYIENGKLVNIKKIDNYRCSKPVIQLLNNIRDDLKQQLQLCPNESSSDRDGTLNVFYKVINFVPKDNKEKYYEILDNCIEKINNEEVYKVLLLSNQALAKKLKYENLYNIFSDGINDAKEDIEDAMVKMQWIDAIEMYDFYTKKRYNELIKLLRNNGYIIKKYNDKQKIVEIFEKIKPNLHLKEVMTILIKNNFLLKSEKHINEEMYMNNYIMEHNNNPDYLLFKKNYIDYNTFNKMSGIIQIDKEDFNQFEGYLKNEIKYSNILSENIKFEEIINYYDFINERRSYITMHKTKGSSINNVLVVMENYFWNQYNFDKLILRDDANNNVYNNTNKLFYVSCSRTKRNLAILKLIDANKIDEFKKYFEGFNIQELD